jgi:hypothetical protein
MHHRFCRRLGWLALGLHACTPLPPAHSQQAGASAGSAADAYRPVYAADWQHGLAPAIGVQANPGDLAVVDDPVVPGRKAVFAAIRRSGDFSHVANGSPRAELLLPAPVKFSPGHDYLIRWSTYLPPDFSFDRAQMVIFTQIHQSATSGPPTLALTLLGNTYTISQRGGAHPEKVSAAKPLCCADADRGNWVHWTLRYVPDASGKQAMTVLYKDGAEVFRASGVPNAYAGDPGAYLKLGLYKAGWQKEPSDVAHIRMYFGPVSVTQRNGAPAPLP